MAATCTRTSCQTGSCWPAALLAGLLFVAVCWLATERLAQGPSLRSAGAPRTVTASSAVGRVVDAVLGRTPSTEPAAAIMAAPPDNIEEFHKYGDDGERILNHEGAW